MNLILDILYSYNGIADIIISEYKYDELKNKLMDNDLISNNNSSVIK